MPTLSTRMKYDFAIVGGGIVGLAHAWAAARSGASVVLLERHPRASGASIRNFGMIWPVGQPTGRMHALALRSRDLWSQVAQAAGIWVDPCGSLHLAHRTDEWSVLEEFCSHRDARPYQCDLLTSGQVIDRCTAANPEGLIGGMWSPTELCVDPREAIRKLPAYLSESAGVEVRFQTPICRVEPGVLTTTAGEQIYAERMVIASGSDFETLYPEVFAAAELVRCKLQMMRTVAQPTSLRGGPHLAGGLTLRHYHSFEICPSLPALKQRIATETPELDRYGIHVMAAQNQRQEVVLGDSHEYGKEISPFDSEEIEALMLRELRRLIRLPDWSIGQRWHGVYAKHRTLPYFMHDVEPGVKIVTGLGGAGMTLSFGLAEEVIGQWG